MRSQATLARMLLASALLMLAVAAQARTRAWLDRDTATIGEPVTLNVETDQAGARPDFSPLRAQFSLSGESSSQQYSLVNGRASATARFGVALTPRQAGELSIPALRVGNDTTAPLRLVVSAGSSADAAQARGNDTAFVETVVDDRQPYVQQSVGVVVRLYFATQLASGELDLDPPDGASLQRIGDDVSTVKTLNGRQYNVVERRFLLVPEHSGPLQLPGARFTGRAVGGFFDDYFGRGNGELEARSASTTLQVRAEPANAPQPWLPLHDLQLRYTATPRQVVAGQAAQVVVEASATGATQAQFPELEVPSVPGAQVFAEPPQYDERFVGGSPTLKMTRRYSIVPNAAGTLVLPGPRLGWWDVGKAQASEARLPDLTLQATPGTGAFATPPPAPASAPAAEPAPAASSALAPSAAGADARPWGWIAAVAVLALLWLLTLLALLLVWRRRRPPTGASAAASTGAPLPERYHLADLRRALDAGGFDEVARILCALGRVEDLDALALRLRDPAQQSALARLQRARWGGEGDLGAVRGVLREAFRNGPALQAEATAAKPVLAPLYPERRG